MLRTTYYYVLRTTNYYVLRSTYNFVLWKTYYFALRTTYYYELRTTQYNVLRTTTNCVLRTTTYHILRPTTYYELRTTNYFVLRTTFYVLLRTTTTCLPSELGSCVNKSSSASSIQQPVTAPTPINAPLRAGPLTAFLTPADISTHIVNLTLADSLPDDTGNAPVAQPVPTTHLRTPQQEDPSLQLPPFTPANNPIFTWGTYSAPDFIHSLEATYAEVVHWRRNCFTVPLGKAGKEFVDELSYLFQAFASASALESIALKSATILPILLLQKPHKASKIKEHITCLERRL